MKKKNKGLTFVPDQEGKGKGKKEPKRIKNTAQKTIPFLELYDNGMFLVDRENGKERYAVCFSLSNTNYVLLKDVDKAKWLEIYQGVFNFLSPDVHYQELYINKPLDMDKIMAIVAPENADSAARTEYFEAWLQNQRRFVREITGHISDTALYFVLSYVKKSKLDNPLNILMQSYQKIAERFDELGVHTAALTSHQALELFHAIYNPFDEGGFILPADMYAKGTNIRDYIAPSNFKFIPKHTALGSEFNRVFYVSGYAASLDDEFISSLLDNKFKIVISKHVDHVDKEIAIKSVTSRLKSLEVERQSRFQRNKQQGTNYIPLDLQSEIETCETILRQLQEKEELFDVGVYISVTTETLEDLEDVSKIITGTCREHLVSIKNAVYRQEDGLASIVPLATDKLKITHYLMSSGLAITQPFTYAQMFDEKGFYYGKNSVSGFPLILNRKADRNGNGFYLGKSGSGKSLYAKMEINDVLFSTATDKVIVIDPEREFVKQCEQIGGTVIKISPNTKSFINPFDVGDDHNQNEDAVKNKADLILNLFAVFKNDKITAQEKSIIDRCTRLVYQDYEKSGWDPEKLPTFVEFYELLKQQPEPECKDLVLYLEMYVFGTVNIFSHKTNVDMSHRFCVFDLLELGANLKKAAMLIILDHVWNEIISNYSKNIYTWLYADEFHLFYGDNEDNNSSGVFFERVFARCRKYGGLATGLTQNMTGVLHSETALSMLQNSQFVVLLEQASENLKRIAALYDLSEKQAARLVSPKVGEGLLISGNIAIPFSKLYPRDNLVYDTITTDFKDKLQTMGV